MSRCLRHRGFTLIELLVALFVMALMAGLSWRGLDAMLRSRAQVQSHSEQLHALQIGLSQWATDLDALLVLPQTPALDWDGRALRLTRRALGDEGIQVVAWSRRTDAGGQWLRWQSLPLQTRAQLEDAWARAAQWAQNPGAAERQREVAVVPLLQWQVFYYRADAWTNPLSSANAVQPGSTSPSGTPAGSDASSLPDGVRLVLTLPATYPVSGTVTRDWVRQSAAGGKP